MRHTDFRTFSAADTCVLVNQYLLFGHYRSHRPAYEHNIDKEAYYSLRFFTRQCVFTNANKKNPALPLSSLAVLLRSKSFSKVFLRFFLFQCFFPEHTFAFA